MALISGPTVGNAISAKDNAITKLVSDMADDEKMIDELFLRVLNRHATPQEITARKSSMRSRPSIRLRSIIGQIRKGN